VAASDRLHDLLEGSVRRIGYMICSKEAGESRANYIAADCADNKLDDEIDSHARHKLLVAVLVA